MNRVTTTAVSRSSEGWPLRVAVIAPPYFSIPPTGYGGTERVVSVLTEGLVAAGHDVTLFAAEGSHTSARLVSPLDETPALGELSSLTDELAHVSTAYRDTGGFDVIHDHTGVGPPLGAAAAGGPPVVHTLHGPWTSSTRRLYAVIHDRVHLVAISRAQLRENPELRYAGVVYNGIDLDLHPFHENKEDFVVFVGRISPEKRPEVAMDAARRAGLPLKMVIKCTEPSEKAYWEDAVAPRLGGDIEVFNQPSHEIKVDLMGRARAMLFPIDWPEPFGLVMAEAMACGTPVIARPLGAAREVIAHGVTGFLCWDEKEMADAICRSAELDPRACRHRVERRFSASSMVSGYESIYYEVASRVMAQAR